MGPMAAGVVGRVEGAQTIAESAFGLAEARLMPEMLVTESESGPTAV